MLPLIDGKCVLGQIDQGLLFGGQVLTDINLAVVVVVVGHAVVEVVVAAAVDERRI